MRINRALILLTIVFLICGCAKTKSENTKNVSSSKMAAISTTSISAGDMHNIFLREYAKKHGSNSNNGRMSYDDVYKLLKEFAQIGKDNGIFDNTTAASIPDTVINDLFRSGYFDSNNMFKDSRTVALMNINYSNSNNNINSVLLNIRNYNGDPSGLIDYAHSQLATLTNLNSGEQQEMATFNSVLESSFSYWSNEEPLSTTGLLDVPGADAAGARYGFSKAMDGAGWICCLLGYSSYYAALFSKAALN